jgi:hypothetical protein
MQYELNERWGRVERSRSALLWVSKYHAGDGWLGAGALLWFFKNAGMTLQTELHD